MKLVLALTWCKPRAPKSDQREPFGKVFWGSQDVSTVSRVVAFGSLDRRGDGVQLGAGSISARLADVEVGARSLEILREA